MSTYVHGLNTAQMLDAWVSGAVINDPTAADILVNTGQLSAGSYLFQVNAHSTVDTYIEFAYRNAADSADNKTAYEIPLPADIDVPFILTVSLTIAQNERIVVRARDTISSNDDVQASIFYSKLAGG